MKEKNDFQRKLREADNHFHDSGLFSDLARKTLLSVAQTMGMSSAAEAVLADMDRQRFGRERFYRLCSRGWLNAMLDIEIGAPYVDEARPVESGGHDG